MKESRSLALIVAYYLSKFDRIAYKNLGFASSTAAHRKIGGLLEVKANFVKNARDEFDPLHDNARVGWYQRPPRPSRAKVADSFQHLTEEELRDVVVEILSSPGRVASEALAGIVQEISENDNKEKRNSVYIIRGPTGRRAEEIFVDYHKKTEKPYPGTLTDMRDRAVDTTLKSEEATRVFKLKLRVWTVIAAA